VPKPKKNVLLLSTQHDEPDISQRPDHKPEVILAYNEGKGGIDIVDKMIDTYCSKVSTLRWPMVVFYTIVDIAALNAYVIWLHKNAELGGVERNKTPADPSSIYYITEDTSASGFWATAILYRPRPLSGDFRFGLFELGGLKNVGNAVEITFLSII
jgi:hypothetical protein